MLSIRYHVMEKLKANRLFFIFIICLFTMRWSFADHYRVPTGSMIPTIQVGDHVLVNKMAYDLKLPFTDMVIMETGVPERGDVIVFKFPKDPSVNYVKRLIALPGDKVEVFNGFVKINGQLTLNTPESLEEYLKRIEHGSIGFDYSEKINHKNFTVQRTPDSSIAHHYSFIVPEGKYFFMGDNRDNSSDSRSWGFVPRAYLKGKVKNVTISVAFEGILPDINVLRFGKEIL